MEDELEELKELSIVKIKVAYNRSIDAEATHMVLWEKFEKNRRNKLIFTLILGIIAASSLIFTVSTATTTEFRIYIVFADIFALLLLLIVIWDTIQGFTGNYGNHGRIVNEALQLREQSISFLQYKLDNLDKQGYIDELKSLEINDTILKEKSGKYTGKLSSAVKSAINQNLENLKIQGIKNYFITQEEIDSATEKLQKYTALRTCEAWIKFE
ncbi:MAG: hypothetical protein KGD58_00635 [Candidatus Lokiarchaeota archaeon]|nr:hypothetical protein [Candidatus Lokiarchaeota archaeon]